MSALPVICAPASLSSVNIFKELNARTDSSRHGP